MRPDELYLRDLLAAALSIGKFLHGVEERQFLQDELLQSAVLQKLTVIGEAAARVSDDLRSKHVEVEWRTIIGLRNVVVHEYFAVSWGTIWSTATKDIPELEDRIRAIIDRLNET